MFGIFFGVVEFDFFHDFKRSPGWEALL